MSVKVKCENQMKRIFFISHVGLPECQQVKTPNCTVKLTRRKFVKTRGTLVPDLPHMPVHSRQSGRQNIITRTHTWHQCSVSTSGAILTTKYGFNLRQNSPLNIENNTGYECLSRMRKSVHWSWHTFEATYAGSLPYYSTTFRCMIGKGPGKQS